MANQKQLIAKEFEFGAKNYSPAPLVAVKAKKWYLWDASGNKYVDLVSAYSAVSLGHANKKIIKALTKQAKRLDVTSRAIHNDVLPVYLEKLSKISGYAKVLPMNSGAEAVETALKLARKWGEKVKGIAKNKAKIIACENNFHGRTIAIISMSTEPQYKDGFGPYLSKINIVKYGDLDSLESQLKDPETAAFIVEPIQGEAGIITPPVGYLSAAKKLCEKYNVLFIADEVQTGLMRTGELFCVNHSGVTPDILVLGKALGGGVYPVSAVLAREEIMSVIKPGDHGSTFGGNPIACAVGMAALDQLIDPKLQQHVVKLGAKAKEFLESHLLKYTTVVKDIRGEGLFIGIEFHPGFKAKDVVYALLKKGVLVKDTHECVLRIAPPLIISEKSLMKSLKKLVCAIEDLFVYVE